MTRKVYEKKIRYASMVVRHTLGVTLGYIDMRDMRPRRVNFEELRDKGINSYDDAWNWVRETLMSTPGVEYIEK